MWVFDATPLIYLAKVDRLSLVQQFDTSCVIPERVFHEVVETGLEQGYPDARRIERSVDADRFDIVSVETTPLLSRLQENSNLSDADVAVLASADAHDGVAVMDETYGRDVAATEGITTRGTAYLVLTLVSEGRLSSDDARTVIDAMIDEGWYCAPDVYTKIVQKLETVSE
jgi:Predicted nucleic acid-binding protein, contains PIN domain